MPQGINRCPGGSFLIVQKYINILILQNYAKEGTA